MKKISELDEGCYLCEHSHEIFGGEYYMCKKKGVMDPNGLCRSFCFDPLKIRVSVQKIPKFSPLGDMMPLAYDKKEKAE